MNRLSEASIDQGVVEAAKQRFLAFRGAAHADGIERMWDEFADLLGVPRESAEQKQALREGRERLGREVFLSAFRKD